jgi:biotin-dependent carboxylase-like uncharacterized protein
MIEVLAPPPFLTVQDMGRQGFRAKGVPVSGAMDPEPLAWANLLVGNPATAAGLEWALGTGRIRIPPGRAFAAAGAPLTWNGMPILPLTAAVAGPDELLELGLPRRRFACLAVAGGIAVEPVLGSRSTYLVAGFGGHEGRKLRRGDFLPLGESRFVPPQDPWGLPEDAGPESRDSIRVVPGPQSDLFEQEAWEGLLSEAYTVSTASDRMGYRLDGPPLHHRGSASLPSEPVCAGAVQVPEGGAPIVLMPDGPTVGGYPKLAVVIGTDLGALAQCPPGSRPRFELVTFDEAAAALRERAARFHEAERAFQSAISLRTP